MRQDPARWHLRELVATVEVAIKALDAEMKLPPSHERGQRIAKICNYLELNKDAARRFGLAPPKKAKRKKKSG